MKRIILSILGLVALSRAAQAQWSTNPSGGIYTNNNILIKDVGTGAPTAAPRGPIDVLGTGNIWLVNSGLSSGQTSYFTGHNYFVPYGNSGIAYIQGRTSSNTGPVALRFRTLSIAGGVPTEAMHIDGDGKVGIGSVIPSAKLYVQDADNNTTSDIGQFYANNLTQGIGIGFNSIAAVGSNANQDIVILPKGTGNVGIGTNTPTGKLDVNGRLVIANPGNIGPIGSGSLLSFSSGGSDVTAIQENYGLNLNGSATQPIKVANASLLIGYASSGVNFGQGNMYAAGNVGIGTTNPSSKLDVNGNIQISSASIPMGLITEVGGTTPLLNLSVNFREANKNNAYRGADFRVDTRDGAPLFQWLARPANGAESTPMVLTESGNLGIGTASPQEKLSITQTTNGNLASFVGLGAALAIQSNPNELDLVSYSAATGYQPIFLRAGANGLFVSTNGSIGIGTVTPDAAYKLSVNGSVRAKEVKVNTGWSDYVFYDNYQLKPLSEVESYILNNRHLPDVPSAAEVEKNGINLGETDALLLKKIEELTLYMIEQNKQLEAVLQENKRLQERTQVLSNKIDQLEKSTGEK